ncbi:MAG: MBL fold metallo-hydrolase [Actinomycetes bacterium]
MKLTVVGCSGSIPGPDSPASCYLIEHSGFRLVVDMGHGSLGALQQHVALDTIDAIVLSHLHADHFIDLTALHVAHRYGPYSFSGPLPVYGPSNAAGQLASAIGLTSPKPLQSSFAFRELSSAASLGPFAVRAERVAHPIEAYGIRFEADDAVLTYSGDTGPCSALIELSREADVLLAESSFMHGAENARDLHMTGRQAGEAARDAVARRLVITHVPPWHDPTVAVAEASEVFNGTIDVATAGFALEVGR